MEPRLARVRNEKVNLVGYGSKPMVPLVHHPFWSILAGVWAFDQWQFLLFHGFKHHLSGQNKVSFLVRRCFGVSDPRSMFLDSQVAAFSVTVAGFRLNLKQNQGISFLEYHRCGPSFPQVGHPTTTPQPFWNPPHLRP